jgi:hypothetical protein
VRLYHERAEHRSGALAAADEEECFTSVGRRLGVYLTTEVLAGEVILSADIETDDASPWEVTGDDDEHRTFVVPASVAQGWPLRSDEA